MKILITGSSGMVGREVVREVRKKGHTVVEYDLDKGKSILDEKQLIKEMKGVQGVIHLAGIIDNENKGLWKINVEGTKKVFENTKKTGVKKFLFMSSTGVYGETKGKINEKTEIKPENEYEKSKAEGEKIVLSQKGKLKVVIVRSAMVLGANDYWKKMFGVLKKKLPLPCSGKNHFQIIYSSELARAIALVFEKGKPGEVYLAAGSEKPTLNEFIEITQGELGLEKKIKHIPTFVGALIGKITGMKLLTRENIRHLSKERNYDTGKIKKLGWKEKTNLRKAVKEVVEELEAKK